MNGISKKAKQSSHFMPRNLTTKYMELNDFKIVRRWCEKENWNPGLHDIFIYYQLGKDDHSLFFENNRPISAISLVKYSPVFFTIGSFIVKENYRKKGYGAATWKKALSRLDNHPDATVLLYAVKKQINRYKKHGFQAQYTNKRWNLTFKTRSLLTHSPYLKKITITLVKEISAYDKHVFSCSRARIFTELCRHPGIEGFVFKADNVIQGYGIIRPCLTGYRIGPLIADSPEIAQCLLTKLLSVSGSEPTIIDIPDCNPQGEQLMKSVGAARDKDYDTIAMIKGEVPPEYKGNISKNYGIFSLEIG